MVTNIYKICYNSHKGVFMARILVSMKDNFLKSIDEVAQNEQRTRSELIREALRAYLKKNKINTSKKAQDNAILLENLLD